MPLYVLGLMGMTRRMQHYDDLHLAAVVAGGGGRRAGHSCRDRLPDRATRRLDPHPRTAPRPDRRSVERPHAGMVDAVAAAGRGISRCCRMSKAATPSGACKQQARSRHAPAAQTRRLRADRNAEKQRDRLRHRLLCRRHRLCADLAYLVDGRSRRVRRAVDHRWSLPCASRRKSKYRPRRSAGSIAPTARRSPHEHRPSCFGDEPMMCAGRCPHAGTGAEADRRRLRLLDFPAQRHRDVFGAVCDLRRAGARHRRRPGRRRNCSTRRSVAIETGCLLVSSYTCGLMSMAIGARKPRRYLSRRRDHVRSRRGVSCARNQRIRRA